MENAYSFPTILVASGCLQADDLVMTLQREGYLILKAQDGAEALAIARVHSRPIQVMLTDENEVNHSLASTVKKYRPHIHVLFLPQTNLDAPAVGGTEATLIRVRKLLQAPTGEAPEKARSAAS